MFANCSNIITGHTDTSCRYIAPPNCLQYQSSLIGTIKSFNFEESQVAAGTGYLSGLDYTICFKKPAGYCSVAYSVPRQQSFETGQSINQQSGQQQGNYQMNPGQYFNIIGMIDKDQAGAGPYECPSDYLQLANVPLCGNRLNPQLNPAQPNPTINTDVVGKLASWMYYFLLLLFTPAIRQFSDI